jgi:predicted hydrocarbon binding protein
LDSDKINAHHNSEPDEVMEKNIQSEIKTDNFIMRTYLETIESIVGYNGLKSVLNYGNLQRYIDCFPPDNNDKVIPEEDLRRLYFSLIELFGHKGAYNLQLKVGRENVRRGLAKLPKMAKFLQITSLLVPETKKIRIGLEKFIETVEKRSIYPPGTAPVLELKEKEDAFILIYRNYWESKGVMSVTPVCGILVGTIEALTEWITGHQHEVKEIECVAMGHPADVIKISKAKIL